MRNVLMPPRGDDSAPAALRKFIERAGLTKERAALDAGYKHASGLQRYTSDDYPLPYFQTKVVDKLAPVLVRRGEPPITAEEIYGKLAGTGVPLYMADRLKIDAGLPVIPNVEQPVNPKVLAPPTVERDIPVYGVAAAGKSGDFTFNGSTVDHLPRLPSIARRQGVFAIYAVGDSMFPWRNPGDPVYVDTVRHPKAGDYVVVECHGKDGEPGPAYLKRLVSEDNEKVRLAQFNPANDRIEIPRRTVKHIYRVIDWPELLAGL